MMMKTLILTCILLPLLVRANEIDKLQTKDDVVHFLIKKVSHKFKKEDIISDSSRGSYYQHNTFYKIDFDKNGLTDLIVDGHDAFIVMDLGKQEYKMANITKGFSGYPSIIKIDSISQIPQIITTREKYMNVHTSDHINIYDTLIFKFGSLLEYNADTLKEFKFDKLRFTTTMCFGECPVFEITINADKSVVYKAIKFNTKQGTFEERISDTYFTTLLSMLKYTNPAKLDSSYTVPWTDDQTAITEVTYNGQIKKIEDYGKIGRYGLTAIYNLLFVLRNKFDKEE
jgi:hypothetical protein